MADARGRKHLRYKVIKGKSTCYFKTVIHHDSFEIKKREEVEQKFCQQNSTIPFGVPANVKLKLSTDKLLFTHYPKIFKELLQKCCQISTIRKKFKY